MEQQKNPFSRARKERKLIGQGIYPATLAAVKVVQVTDKTTQEKKDKIVMAFDVKGENTEISAWFTPSSYDNSQLVKFLKGACGDAFTPAIQGDPEKMWTFVRSLQGRDFSIVVTQSNGWNNISAAVMAKAQEPKQPEPEALTDEDLFKFADGEAVNI